jgi:hypothetical protein
MREIVTIFFDIFDMDNYCAGSVSGLEGKI